MYLSPINNSQTNFEARCPNAKRRVKVRHPQYPPLYKRKPKLEPVLQTPVSTKTESIDAGKESGVTVFRNSAYNPDYDWRLDTNHIPHGKEVEPPDEFFEALCEWYSHSKNAGAGILYDESDDLYMDEEWWSQG